MADALALAVEVLRRCLDGNMAAWLGLLSLGNASTGSCLQQAVRAAGLPGTADLDPLWQLVDSKQFAECLTWYLDYRHQPIVFSERLAKQARALVACGGLAWALRQQQISPQDTTVYKQWAARVSGVTHAPPLRSDETLNSQHGPAEWVEQLLPRDEAPQAWVYTRWCLGLDVEPGIVVPVVGYSPAQRKGLNFDLKLAQLPGTNQLVDHPTMALVPRDAGFMAALEQTRHGDSVLWQLVPVQSQTRLEVLEDSSLGGAVAVAYMALRDGSPLDSETLVAAALADDNDQLVQVSEEHSKLEAAQERGLRRAVLACSDNQLDDSVVKAFHRQGLSVVFRSTVDAALNQAKAAVQPEPTGPNASPGALFGNMADGATSSSRAWPLIWLKGPSNVEPFDIWTPGVTQAAITAHFEPALGSEMASRIWQHSSLAVDAVARGDFLAERAIGEALEREADGQPCLMAEGAYLSGEGFRLLADLEQDPAIRQELRKQAAAKYHLCAELLPGDPRPLRGLGRTYEVDGRLGDALDLFRKAKALCLASLEQQAHRGLEHEALRTSRHFIHCLLDVRSSDRLSVWHREHKRSELEGYVHHCANLHMDLMPRLKTDPRWFGIEWFMALVFLAKAWGAVGSPERKTNALVHALLARRKLIGPERPLTPIERANLAWWGEVALTEPMPVQPALTRHAERLQTHLAGLDDRAVIQVLDEALLYVAPPWEVASRDW